MASPDTRKLQTIYAGLTGEGQRALLDYAEFLQQRYAASTSRESEPRPIERPQQESVVLAIRRLSETYPMLDRQALLHDTAAFMMQHVVQGREAVQVIDDLENYFRRQYESFRSRQTHV